MEAKGWRGPPACRENVKLLLGVQLLADRPVSTQLTSSEAGRKTGSVDYSHTGGQAQCQQRRSAPLKAQLATEAAEALFAGSLGTLQCQTLHGFSALLCVPDIRREE